MTKDYGYIHRQMSDELGELPWRWRNLLHWQNVHARYLSETNELLRSVRNVLLCILFAVLAFGIIGVLGAVWQ